MISSRPLLRQFHLWLLAFLGSAAVTLSARADQAVYTDSLQNGWGIWGWATIDQNHTTTVHSGSKSISVTAGAWQALYLGRSAESVSNYVYLTFWIHGGSSGGQLLQVQGLLNGSARPAVSLPPLSAGVWQQVTLSLESLGVAGANDFTGFWIQERSGNTWPAFYVDDINLVSDTTPPVVQSVNPVAGTVSSLTSVTVTFSEPVTGVDAADLRLNGLPAASLSGSGAVRTFTFIPPSEGTVAATWQTGHGITDLASPANAFDATVAGATWQYQYVDTLPPVVTNLFPDAGMTIRALSQVEVMFNESVTGVNASDLLINGQPATNLNHVAGGPFVFSFPPCPAGPVTFAWAASHGIADTASTPNAFAGGSWSLTVDPALLSDLVITEILAANISTNGLADEDGEPQDWIEIYNRGTNTVNLAGWSLSDDPDLPGLWTFPARTLAPDAYLVVFGSGKDRRPASTASNLHTNFKLSGAGEHLGLYTSDSPRVLAGGFTPYPEQRNDVSYGLDYGGNLRYFAAPTPGAANGASTIAGVCEPVHANVSRGFFTAPFDLILSCPTPGVTLRYTTDGSEPGPTSPVFPATLRITNTTFFRAAAFKTNYLPSKTETHSYFFNLSPELRSLPVISIVTASNNLYGPSGILGINGGYFDSNDNYAWKSNAPGDYHNPSQHGLAWERATSVEWIRPEDNSGFQTDCGMRIQGSDYQRPRITPLSKVSFRLYFRGDYGPGRLEYPLFPLTGVDRFDQVVLRAGYNEQNNPFIRDEIHRRLSHDMGQIASHGTLAVVFVNGVYFTNAPFYNPAERVHEDFLQQHLGGGDDWDVVGPYWAATSDEPGIIDGDRIDFTNLVYFVNTQDVTNQTVYTNIARWLDLTNFADYCLLNAYAAMGDWPANNFRAAKDRSTSGPWRFLVWDAEWGMGIYSRDTNINSFTLTEGGPDNSGLGSVSYSEIAQMYDRLRASPEFRLLWADRVHKHFFNGGALTSGSISNRFNELQSQLLALIPSMEIKMLEWARDRQGIFFSQMAPYGLIASTNAPGFNQFGGRVPVGFNLVMTNLSGTILYTTNGADPRVAFTGAVSASAKTNSGTLPINTTVTVKARSLRGTTNWSALTEATFVAGSLGLPLRITEIMYNPIGGSLYEFVELKNTSARAVDLSGMYFSGIDFMFPEGASLAAGARLVLGSNTDTNAWKALYSGVTAAGWFGGSLNNGGERLALFDRFGNLITSVDYDDEAGWPTAADGGGRSLEIIDASGDPDAPANWKASAANNGTPGANNSTAPAPTVYLNEVMAENGGAVANSGTFPDWIELYNPGTNTVNLAGWSLTDDGDARKFVFPSTNLSAGGYLVVWCDATTNTTPGLHTGFSLDNDGESVFLYDATTNRIDAITFGRQLTNYTVGRVAGAWTLTTPTLNATNVAVTLASATNLVLNEWMANPVPGNDDWLELYNRSATQPVALKGVYLATSNQVFQLNRLSFLPPQGYIQLLADEGVGTRHLDLKLSATGETLALADATGSTIQSVAFGAQAEGISQGRLPNGTGSVINFPGSASPGAPNYTNTYVGPVISEVLARNRAINISTQIVDFVELYNSAGSNVSLNGMSLSVNSLKAGQWLFPSNTTMAAGAYLLIKCDGASAAATNAGNFNTGEALDGDSGGVYLFNAAGQVVNHVEYGPQVNDLSIGLTGGQWRLLSAPTPGAANAAAAVLGANTALRLNEWMPAPASGADWFELYNTTNRPVDLGTLSLSDDPSLVGCAKFQPAPLSFIGAKGFVKWVADASAGQGRNHVNFGLDAAGDSLLLYGVNGTNFTLIDALGFGAQSNGVSSGRLLDGAANILPFPGTPTPGESNYRLLPTVVINEALAHTDPPLEDALELFNPTASPVDLTGWYVSNSRDNLHKCQLTNTTIIPAGGYTVIYEYQFNNGTTNAFTLNSAHGDEIWLTAASGGVETGERATVQFGASFNGASFGRVVTSTGVDFAPLTQRTFGVDSPTTLAQFRAGTGRVNAAPLVGPVILSEILYHPPGGTNGSVQFVELCNVTATAVPLYAPAYPTNHWKLAGGVSFTFPASTTLAAGGCLLVVDFDPATNAATVADFRARYGISAAVPLFGPFAGKLNNAADRVELYRPDTPQPTGSPDAGFVPYVIADRVNYTDTAPWPAAADGTGLSLQRLDAALYGNEPLHWTAAVPTPGTASTPVADSDGDGIPDVVEVVMGLNPADPTDAGLDPDGDGLTNLQEYIAGTDPLDPASALRLERIVASADMMTISFQAASNRTYSVLYTGSLDAPVWLNLTNVPAQAASGLMSVTDGQGGVQTRFYRVVTPAWEP